jgi:Na+/H+ antiporter NhaC
MMLFIFLMAGAFSGIAAEAGGVESCANLLLSVIPQKLAVPGLFLIACLISMSMGTSVGTISVLVPIAAAISAASSISAPLAVGTVVGGAMFGDNLSFISDTTIAATKTQGVEMKDKFRTNVKIALPAAVLTLLLLTLFSFHIEAPSVASYPYRIGLALPYFIVLLLSLFGINVFLVLGIGLLLFSGAGLILGTLSLNSMFSSMGKGTNGMFETMIVTILVASLGALIEKNGGFDAILSFIRTHFHGQKGGAFGIMILTSLLDIASANNTVAIVMAAPIARTISREYRIDPRQTASLLDTSSCICQGIIPYGAQLLIAANLSSLSSMSIIPWLFYPFLLFVSVIVSILLQKEYKKA